MSSPENYRHYAAGFLGAAAMLLRTGHEAGASLLLTEVYKYTGMEDVDCPAPMRMVLAEIAMSPSGRANDVNAIEAMFRSDANTMLEQAGIRFGSA